MSDEELEITRAAVESSAKFFPGSSAVKLLAYVDELREDLQVSERIIKQQLACIAELENTIAQLEVGW